MRGLVAAPPRRLGSLLSGLQLRNPVAYACVAFALGACFEQWRLLVQLVSRFINEDHALLWLMAQDWAHLRVREPTFYGQPYGVTFEAIPTALLHAFGWPYKSALPAALMLMALLAWWCLAFAAWRRGLWTSALLAAAAPLLLNIDHWVVVSVIGTSAGRLLAAVCAAVCLSADQRPRKLAIAVALAGLATLFDAAAAPLAIPALVWASLPWLRERRYWLAISIGLIAPLSWYAFSVWFEASHPEHALHPSWGYNPELGALRENWANPDRLFATHALDLLPHAGVYFVLSVGLVVVAIAARAWRALAVVSCLIALYAVLMSMPKTLDGRATLWFPSSRMTITAPMAYWFAICVTSQAAAARMRDAVNARTLSAIVVVLLACGTFLDRAAHWSPRVQAILQAGLNDKGLELRPVRDVYRLCHDVAAAARSFGTNIVVFPFDRTANYACGALHPELLTVFPGYERRAWVLRELSEDTTDRMLVWGFHTDDCKKKRMRRALTRCEEVAGGHAVELEFQRRAPLDVVRDIGLRPRPFGPGCHPNEVATCTWWASRYGG
jgi:hypothetical protein